MDIKQLRYFAQVAQLGSYTRAAEFLNLTQPVLSRQVRQLEIELRQNLLIRHGRGVKLTESGKILLEHCHLLFQQLERAHEDLNQSEGKIKGHVVLGMPPTVSRLLSVDIVKAFRAKLPDATLSISEGLTVNILENLVLGRHQVALLNNPDYFSDIQTQLLTTENLCLIARRDDLRFTRQNPVNAQALAQLPLIIPSAPNTFRLLLEREMARLNQKPNIVLEIDSIETALALVLEKMGYAILSPRALALTQDADDLQTVPLSQPVLSSRLYLGTSVKYAKSRLQAALIEIILSVCALHFQPRHQAS